MSPLGRSVVAGVVSLVVLGATPWTRPAASAAGSSLSRRDASVSRQSTGESWSIGAGGVPLDIGFARDGTLVLKGFGENGGDALLEDVTDASIVIDGQEVVLGDREADGVFFGGDRSEAYRGGVRLSLIFNAPEQHARIVRNFAAYPGTPVVETWFEVERLDGGQPIEASSIAAWRVGANGRDLRWRRGLEMGRDPDLSFREEVRTLGDGDRVELGSPGRSTQTNLPWITVATPGGTFFAGLMWSGPWRLTARGDASGVQVKAGLDDTVTTVPEGRALEGVHGFIGVVAGGDADVAAAMRTFLVDGLRAGRGFPALVTYNTWFSYGVQTNDGVVAREAHEAALAGAELFQLDAGWYTNTGRTGHYDFTSGLGSWQVDADRFRRGIRGVADVVHGFDMKFGLWVEPERTDLATVGEPGGPRQEWLATDDGAYRPGVANQDAGYAQVCLTHPDAWQWVLDHLVHLVEHEGVDYLEVDLNDWVNCTREGHGHGARDGPFTHVQALYRLLEALRQRFPELLIENCAGGGNRIDLGLARYTDAGWMDDRTTPSAHVRQNFQGLAQMLPPTYLLAYTMSAQDEPLDPQHDFALLTRSRMGGVLGLSYNASELSEAGFVLLEREVAVYKRLRELVGRGSAVLLTPQATPRSRPAWEVVERVHPTGAAAVVLAYQNDAERESVRIVPQRLDPEATFEVRSIEQGRLGTYKGRLLMQDGFELAGSPNTAAHVLLIEPAASAGGSKKRP